MIKPAPLVLIFSLLFSPPCFSGESYYSYGAGKERIDGAGTIYYYVNDQVDSARVILKEDQTVEWSSDYQPFGQEVNVQGAGGTEDKTFSGKEHDQTGLYYFGARYYDPATGRFTSPDPVREFASSYTYVGNNPLNGLDRNGAWSDKAGLSGGNPDAENWNNPLSSLRFSRAFDWVQGNIAYYTLGQTPYVRDTLGAHFLGGWVYAEKMAPRYGMTPEELYQRVTIEILRGLTKGVFAAATGGDLDAGAIEFFFQKGNTAALDLAAQSFGYPRTQLEALPSQVAEDLAQDRVAQLMLQRLRGKMTIRFLYEILPVGAVEQDISGNYLVTISPFDIINNQYTLLDSKQTTSLVIHEIFHVLERLKRAEYTQSEEKSAWILEQQYILQRPLSRQEKEEIRKMVADHDLYKPLPLKNRRGK